VPNILEESEFSLKMDFIDGRKVKDVLNEKNYKYIGEKIAIEISKMHNNDIVHGDLTTSNMIFKGNEKNNEHHIYFIDFGLGFHSNKVEDKAIDLYLLHEALESTHFNILDSIWAIILKTYEKNYTNAEKVIKTLSSIEMRRRYTKKH